MNFALMLNATFTPSIVTLGIMWHDKCIVRTKRNPITYAFLFFALTILLWNSKGECSLVNQEKNLPFKKPDFYIDINDPPEDILDELMMILDEDPESLSNVLCMLQ